MELEADLEKKKDINHYDVQFKRVSIQQSPSIMWAHCDSGLLSIPNESALQKVMERKGVRDNLEEGFDDTAYAGSI